MKKKFIELVNIFSIVTFVAGLMFSCAGAASISETLQSGPDTKITIFHTNDTHGRIVEGKYDGMGFAKIASLVEDARKTENVLLLDGGDTFHGTTFAALSKGESVAQVMNLLKFDAMASGNHDFNYGTERLLELDSLTDFPVLAANVYKDGKLLFKPYIIKEINGLKVAIFGLATPETAFKTHPLNIEEVEFRDPVFAAAQMVEELKQIAHVIIMTAHLGIDEDSEVTSSQVAKIVPGISLIVDGHSHSPIENGLLVNDTLIVSAGWHDKNLGIVELDYKDGKANVSAQLISKDDAGDIIPNERVMELISDIETDNKIITEVVVGSSPIHLQGERSDVRTRQTNLGDLITMSQIWVSGADAAILNGGAIRKSINVGEITKGEIISVIPFGNTVLVIEVTGQDILDAIENGISAYPDTSGAFPQVAGIKFSFDESQDAGGRITSAVIAGKDIDPLQSYELVTNDFLAAGGDNYKMLTGKRIVAEYGTMDEVFLKYINTMEIK